MLRKCTEHYLGGNTWRDNKIKKLDDREEEKKRTEKDGKTL